MSQWNYVCLAYFVLLMVTGTIEHVVAVRSRRRFRVGCADCEHIGEACDAHYRARPGAATGEDR